MKRFGKLVLVFCAAAPFFALASCEKGAGEKAGEEIDEAVDDAGRAIEDAAD
jgi:hypothetical protein